MLVGVNSVTLAQLANQFDRGNLGTEVGTVLPLADARLAHEMLEGTRPRKPGKIVLEVTS
jgi:NADPH:quinone reductase-like Zn-dependent oxidoreductase